MDSFIHKPVLLEEVINDLKIKQGGIYIDGTIGGGGHTNAILKSDARVLGIDRDNDAILHLEKKFESEIKHQRLTLVRGNFAEMEKIAEQSGIKKVDSDKIGVDGILLDLGVSSNQFEKSGRGFSFRKDEPLDMRMDESSNFKASEIVNTFSEDELYEIFLKYGEERRAREVARHIVSIRKTKPIETSRVLAEVILEVIKPNGPIHPATKIFQALRIVVNSEIENLKQGINKGFRLLNEGARFEIISFHSLEDRVVKLAFLEFEREGMGRVITKRPVVASEEEVRANPRARSAKLRVIERLSD